MSNRFTDRRLYAFRCATAACLAYEVASLIGLQHPVWAPISALVVSQETVEDTVASIRGRTLGTLTGAAVALLVSGLASRAGLPMLLQVAIAVAFCAAITIGRAHMRVALWTCPLVLAAASSGPARTLVAASRASEVILGAVIGGLVAALFRILHRRCAKRPSTAPKATGPARTQVRT